MHRCEGRRNHGVPSCRCPLLPCTDSCLTEPADVPKRASTCTSSRGGTDQEGRFARNLAVAKNRAAVVKLLSDANTAPPAPTKPAAPAKPSVQVQHCLCLVVPRPSCLRQCLSLRSRLAQGGQRRPKQRHRLLQQQQQRHRRSQQQQQQHRRSLVQQQQQNQRHQPRSRRRQRSLRRRQLSLRQRQRQQSLQQGNDGFTQSACRLWSCGVAV